MVRPTAGAAGLYPLQEPPPSTGVCSLLHLAQPPTDLDHELIDLRNLRRPLRRARRAHLASNLASDLALELGPALLLPEYLEVRLGKG